MAQADDRKILEIAKKRYALALDRDRAGRAERLDDLRFSVLLEQWPQEVKNARENDPNGARPCLVVDKVNQYIKQVVNDIRQNRPGIKVRGVNDEADAEVAEVIQGVTRHIEDYSRASQAYDWAAELAVRTGLGYFRIITEYSGQDSFDQNICIKRVVDSDSVVTGEYTEPDGSDMQYAFIVEPMTLEDFEANYPNAETIDFDTDKEYEWFGEERVLVAEYIYLEKRTENLLFLEDGTVRLESQYWEEAKASGMTPMPVLKTRQTTVNQCKWVKMNGKEILEKKDFPSRFIPVFPVIGDEGYVDGKRILKGLVRPAKDPQRLYNYVRSAFTEAVALAPKAPYIAADGQIEDFPEWEDANTKNYSVLRYKPVSVNGTVVGPPQRQQFAGVPTGLQQDMQLAEHDIQAALGMYNASLGERSNEKSGKAILARQKEGDTATFHYSDNLARTIQHAGRVIVEMIPVIFDTQRVLRIIGEDGSEDYAAVNPEQPQAVVEQVDDSGKIKKIYNLGVGKYDVTVTVGPSYNTKRMEAADAMTQILQGNSELMNIIGDLYFKALDMPFSEEIAKRMKKMLPPQIQDDEDGQAEIPPQVQAAMNQLQRQLQVYDAQMQELAAENQELKFEREAKIVETNGKVEEAKIKQQSEIAKTMADIEIAKANAVDPRRLEIVEQGLMNLFQALQQSTQIQEESVHQMPDGSMMPDADMAEQIPPEIPPPEMMPQEQPPQEGGFFMPNEQG